MRLPEDLKNFHAEDETELRGLKGLLGGLMLSLILWLILSMVFSLS